MPKIAELDVYPLCLGTNTFGWTSTRAEAFAVLDEYTAAGGNFLDTADAYVRWAGQGGESEEIIGQWLRESGRRAEVVLATKVGKLPPHDGLSAEAVSAAVDASLQRLGVEQIDLLYAHYYDPEHPTDPAIFDRLIRDGKIRTYGLSNHSPAQVREVLEAADRAGVARPVALQPHYNLLLRGEYEGDLQDLTVAEDLAVMPYYSLAAGLLTGKYDLSAPLAGARAQMAGSYLNERTPAIIDAVSGVAQEHNVEPAAVAIAWLLSQRGITAPIASARTPEQLFPLFEGVSIVLSEEELAQLEQASA
ncbi:aldo/keto reductase [Scrofimicrobium sp. R131]|uniref:Aldo/keto reductase n=1 Tax=Scrofimicrobium appendicitidis TaxID=3079930 RepID=A0AAU7V9A1_9ACTO